MSADRLALPARNSRVSVRLHDGRVVAQRVEVARGIWRRFLGLMGRSEVEPEGGLWLIPCRSIHMFFMRTAIDVVFLDRRGQVVRAVSRMRPWSLRPVSVTLIPVRGAHSALELAPGTVDRLGLQAAESLRFSTSPAAPAIASSLE